MNKIQMNGTVSRQDRFNAFERMLEASRASDLRMVRAIDDARYWESFPETYTPAQVAAGQILLLCLGKDTEEGAVKLVLSLGQSAFMVSL